MATSANAVARLPAAAIPANDRSLDGTVVTLVLTIVPL